MSVNTETLAAFSQAITEAMGKRIDRMEENMADKFEKQSETIQTSIKSGMEEVMTTMVKRQDAFEYKSDQQFKALENNMCERQSTSENKNDLRFNLIENQLSKLNSTIEKFPLLQSQQHPHAASLQPGRPYPGTAAGPPPHPALLPQPSFPTHQSENSGWVQPRPAHIFSAEQTEVIKDIVHDARYIVGLGPITSENIENALGEEPGDKVRNAAINFMRKALKITCKEIENDEVVETFLPDDTSIPQVYARFESHAHADFIMEVVRSLRNKELKVVKCVPKQFRARNRALENEAFILRQRTVPSFKTKIEYSEDDLVLS